MEPILQVCKYLLHLVNNYPWNESLVKSWEFSWESYIFFSDKEDIFVPPISNSKYRFFSIWVNTTIYQNHKMYLTGLGSWKQLPIHPYLYIQSVLDQWAPSVLSVPMTTGSQPSERAHSRTTQLRKHICKYTARFCDVIPKVCGWEQTSEPWRSPLQEGDSDICSPARVSSSKAVVSKESNSVHIFCGQLGV